MYRESASGGTTVGPEITPEIPIERFEVFATELDHPECLAFDRDGYLWAGGEAGQIYRISPAGVREVIAEIGGFSAGLAWTPDHAELYVCNPKYGIVRVNRAGLWSVVQNTIATHSLISPNYGVFDRRGNFYVTDSGNWNKRNGWLLRYAPDGRGEVLAGPFGYANGLALSADEQQLFMVESDTDSIHRIDLANGQVSLYATSVGRFPDGLALDSEGHLFASCYASDDIHRISPTQDVTLFAYDRWAILLSRPTNIAFHEGYLYASNLGRTTITRAYVGRAGKPLVNLR
jgi:gluconolactonase